MAKSSGKLAIAIIAVTLVVVILLSGTIKNVFPVLPDIPIPKVDLSDGDDSDDSIDGSSAISFLLVFKDRTVRRIGDTPSYSLLPLMITFEGQDVSTISPEVIVKLSGVGITNWKITASMQTEFYKTPETTPKTSASSVYTLNGSSWSSDTEKTVARYSVPYYTLDDVAKKFGDGSYLLQVKASLKLEVTVNGKDEVWDATVPARGLEITYKYLVPRIGPVPISIG